MVIGIRPTVDFVFKLLFGSPEHTRVTIHFLNAILGKRVRIRQVTICNPFLGKVTEDDKLSILDILAVDEHGRMINIEIQTTVPLGLSQRLAFYVSSLYSGQLTEGTEYRSLHPAISICVLTQPMFVDDNRLHLDFRLREKSGLVLTDDLQVHLLQLSNLSVTAQNVSQASPIEQWAYFLLNVETMTLDEVRRLFPDSEFSEAAGVLQMISKNPEQRQFYDARLKYQRDQAMFAAVAAEAEDALRKVEEAEKRIESARKESLEQGIEQGRDVGLREGIEKGRLLGSLTMLQNLLGIAETTSDELSNYSEAALSELVEQLRQQLRNRGL